MLILTKIKAALEGRGRLLFTALTVADAIIRPDIAEIWCKTLKWSTQAVKFTHFHITLLGKKEKKTAHFEINETNVKIWISATALLPEQTTKITHCSQYKLQNYSWIVKKKIKGPNLHKLDYSLKYNKY